MFIFLNFWCGKMIFLTRRNNLYNSSTYLSVYSFLWLVFTLQKKKENQVTRCLSDSRNSSTVHDLLQISVQHVIISRLLQNVRLVKRLSCAQNTENSQKNSHKSYSHTFLKSRISGIFLVYRKILSILHASFFIMLFF